MREGMPFLNVAFWRIWITLKVMYVAMRMAWANSAQVYERCRWRNIELQSVVLKVSIQWETTETFSTGKIK
jgi:hypothetical protein